MHLCACVCAVDGCGQRFFSHWKGPRASIDFLFIFILCFLVGVCRPFDFMKNARICWFEMHKRTSRRWNWQSVVARSWWFVYYTIFLFTIPPYAHRRMHFCNQNHSVSPDFNNKKWTFRSDPNQNVDTSLTTMRLVTRTRTRLNMRAFNVKQRFEWISARPVLCDSVHQLRCLRLVFAVHTIHTGIYLMYFYIRLVLPFHPFPVFISTQPPSSSLTQRKALEQKIKRKCV